MRFLTSNIYCRSANGQKQRLQLHVLRLIQGPQGLEGQATKVSIESVT